MFHQFARHRRCEPCPMSSNMHKVLVSLTFPRAEISSEKVGLGEPHSKTIISNGKSHSSISLNGDLDSAA